MWFFVVIHEIWSVCLFSKFKNHNQKMHGFKTEMSTFIKQQRNKFGFMGNYKFLKSWCKEMLCFSPFFIYICFLVLAIIFILVNYSIKYVNFSVLIVKCVRSIQGHFEYTEKLVYRLPFDKVENSTKISTMICKISLAIKKWNSTKCPKGQLVLKCPFGVFESSKKPTIFFPGFLP